MTQKLVSEKKFEILIKPRNNDEVELYEIFKKLNLSERQNKISIYI